MNRNVFQWMPEDRIGFDGGAGTMNYPRIKAPQSDDLWMLPRAYKEETGEEVTVRGRPRLSVRRHECRFCRMLPDPEGLFPLLLRDRRIFEVFYISGKQAMRDCPEKRSDSLLKKAERSL